LRERLGPSASTVLSGFGRVEGIGTGTAFGGNNLNSCEQLHRRNVENNFNAEDAEERRVEMRKAFPRLVTA
jgi:hypothetical protein